MSYEGKVYEGHPRDFLKEMVGKPIRQILMSDVPEGMVLAAGQTLTLLGSKDPETIKLFREFFKNTEKAKNA